MSERPRCEQCEKYRARIHELSSERDRRRIAHAHELAFVIAERDAAIRALGIANRPLADAPSPQGDTAK